MYVAPPGRAFDGGETEHHWHSMRLVLGGAEVAHLEVEPGCRGRSGVVMGLKVSSREAVDRLYDDVTGAGYGSQQAPYDAFWGARYAIVEDPDGNAVGLMSPIDSERRSAPPSM